MTRFVRWLGFALALMSLIVFAVWWRNLGSATEADASLYRVLVNATVFGAFAGHHSLFARRSTKTLVIRFVPAELERTAYVCVASLLLALVTVLWKGIGGEVYLVSGRWALVLHGLQAFGGAIGLLAARHFSLRELAGLASSTPAAQLKFGGPYRVVRHPLYTSIVLMLGATPHMTGDRLLFIVLLLVYLALAMPLEERSLTAQFGHAYPSYRSRVRWRLIPYIH